MEQPNDRQPSVEKPHEPASSFSFMSESSPAPATPSSAFSFMGESSAKTNLMDAEVVEAQDLKLNKVAVSKQV
jgi:hypothetical protein